MSKQQIKADEQLGTIMPGYAFHDPIFGFRQDLFALFMLEHYTVLRSETKIASDTKSKSYDHRTRRPSGSKFF